LELINDSQLPEEVRAKAVKNVVENISEKADRARSDIDMKQTLLSLKKRNEEQRWTVFNQALSSKQIDAFCYREQEDLDKAMHLSAWSYYALKKVREELVNNKRYSEFATEINLEKPKASARTLQQIRMELDDNLRKRIENGAAVLSPKVMEEALEIEKIRGTHDNPLLVPSRANPVVR
jgi:N-glycosylase/DNA lyase